MLAPVGWDATGNATETERNVVCFKCRGRGSQRTDSKRVASADATVTGEMADGGYGRSRAHETRLMRTRMRACLFSRASVFRQ